MLTVLGIYWLVHTSTPERISYGKLPSLFRLARFFVGYSVFSLSNSRKCWRLLPVEETKLYNRHAPFKCFVHFKWKFSIFLNLTVNLVTSLYILTSQRVNADSLVTDLKLNFYLRNNSRTTKTYYFLRLWDKIKKITLKPIYHPNAYYKIMSVLNALVSSIVQTIPVMVQMLLTVTS